MKPLYLITITLLTTILLSSCVKDELYNGPASITGLSYDPASVTPDDAVTVTANITALTGIDNASLLFKLGAGSYNSVVMTTTGNNNYTAVIPKQADKAVLTFYISVRTKGGIENKSAEKTYTVGAVPPDYASIILNEVDGNKKFVELYNNSDKAISITGMAIIKNGTSLKNEDGSPLWVVPAGVSIPARGYGIIKCSGYTATADPAAVIIGIVSDGMSAKQTLLLELTKPDGSVLNTFQRGVAPWGVTISAIAATDSYSRCPDGTGSWKTAASSAGKANTIATGDIPPL